MIAPPAPCLARLYKIIQCFDYKLYAFHSMEFIGSTILIWQLFYMLFLGGILFLIIRLLIIKNFPGRRPQLNKTWVGIPPYPIGIFWRAEDARFVAEVPDLPGCVADGATQAEALANASVVVEEWLKTAKELNRIIPAPRPRLHYT
jgi:predicted RNase H-like HicB family nuclease